MKINFIVVKKIILILFSLLIIFSLSYSVFADGKASDMIKNSYKGTTTGTGVSDAATKAEKVIGTILSVIRIVSAGIAVVILIVIACKYMLASAGDRADIKKYAINYIIGAVILFSASVLVSIIKNATDSALKTD